MTESTQPNPATTSIKKISLKDFINDNDKLFTAIGVVGALAALFTTIKDGQALSFFAFVLLVVLDLELWGAFPKSSKSSWNLQIFQIVSQILLISIAIYIWNDYRSFVKPYLGLLIYGLFFVIFAFLDKRTKISVYFTKKISSTKHNVRNYAILLASVISIGIVLAYIIAYYLQQFI
jgi:hypothetical protein